MDYSEVLNKMTFEEKALILTGVGNMATYSSEKLGVEEKNFADGPHGTRLEKEKNCTKFPSLFNIGNSWNIKCAEKMGAALADECIPNNINMLLGPGVNIKRHILCGRNFEYISEDPLLAGELGAGYINGLQKKGVSASLKHFALNNQEKYRTRISVETDERTMREIYLKPFEIAVKKSQPDSVMCSYNKVNAIWCSENEYLLKTILKDEWGFEGIVVSDWGAVHNISRAVKAGLDLQMPQNTDIVKELRDGIEKGLVTEKEIDEAVLRVLKFADKRKLGKISYNRDTQHAVAREIARESIVLMKNSDETLPITEEKYKKILVMGEYALNPLISGQGSSEVYQNEEYTDSPLEELRKLLPNTEIKYIEAYKKSALPTEMVWPKTEQWLEDIKSADLVLMFGGDMESENTEQFDKASAYIEANQSYLIEYVIRFAKRTAVVLQSGGAIICGDWGSQADAILNMGLAGESGGGAIADVLCGKVNPSGKLSETFPCVMRKDLEYPGNQTRIVYKEKADIGYRYYDKNPDEILYPFGHGLSYTEFEYSDLCTKKDGENVEVSFKIKNIGKTGGSEVVQLYVGDVESTVEKSVKELKRFDKIYLNAGEKKKVSYTLTKEDFSYYNIMLHKDVAENGEYVIYIGASSRDIRLKESFIYETDMPYTMKRILSEAMIG